MSIISGVLADIKYVEDGKYDKPTAAYPYRVSDQIDTITFSWVSHAQVHYTMDIVSNDPLVLPIANLRREGYVPTKLQGRLRTPKIPDENREICRIHHRISLLRTPIRPVDGRIDVQLHDQNWRRIHRRDSGQVEAREDLCIPRCKEGTGWGYR